jgi:hypothetical protein
MSRRYDSIGIKQAVRLEWMQHTVSLLSAGHEPKTIRNALHEFLYERKADGTEGKRGEEARSFVVSMLMRIWVTPDAEVCALRDTALQYVQTYPHQALAVHWAMIAAAYPFWFHVGRQTGRLLALQEQVTYAQIINRLKEQYGDRQTVSRSAQFIIRSFISWGVLKDSVAKGCYHKEPAIALSDARLCLILFESALLATAEARGALGLLQNNPAFFPFQLPLLTGDAIAELSSRIEVVRYGLDDELLRLT